MSSKIREEEHRKGLLKALKEQQEENNKMIEKLQEKNESLEQKRLAVIATFEGE